MFWLPCTYLFLLALHWFADFVVQTPWQAANKSKNVWALSAHVFNYSLLMTFGLWSVLSCFALVHPLIGRSTLIWATVVFFTATFLSHFATDAITSRINAKRFAASVDALQNNDPGAPQLWSAFFEGVGFDQLVHQATILATLVYVVHKVLNV